MKQNEIKELRNFGLLLSVFFLVVFASGFVKSGHFNFYEVTMSFIMASLALVYPQSLKIFHKYWILFGEYLGKISSSIILTVMFFGIITPISFLMKIVRKDLLTSKINKDKDSYWIERSEQPGSTSNQF